MVCLMNFINTSGLLSVMTWYLFSTFLMNLVNAVFIRAVPFCSWSWVLYSIVPLVIYAFLYLVGGGDCQKISAGECITCGVYCKGFKQVYGQYMSCLVELSLSCCGMRYGSGFGSSFVVGVWVNSVKLEVNEQFMDGSLNL